MRTKRSYKRKSKDAPEEKTNKTNFKQETAEKKKQVKKKKLLRNADGNYLCSQCDFIGLRRKNLNWHVKYVHGDSETCHPINERASQQGLKDFVNHCN